MEFKSALIKGKLIKRYKRFMADVELENGEVITAHCANSGAMLGVKEPGLDVYLSPAENPNRKLKYTWEIIDLGNNLVGVNTQHPNNLVEEAIKSGTIKELQGYDSIRREVKYGKNSRIDLLLEGDKPCFVEVKNVHLLEGDIAYFPDSVTARGAKHMEELGGVVKSGSRAVVIYVVQREDAKEFQIASHIDPYYQEKSTEAHLNGVEFYVYACAMTTQSITISHRIDFNMEKIS